MWRECLDHHQQKTNFRLYNNNVNQTKIIINQDKNKTINQLRLTSVVISVAEKTWSASFWLTFELPLRSKKQNSSFTKMYSRIADRQSDKRNLVNTLSVNVLLGISLVQIIRLLFLLSYYYHPSYQ